MDIIVYFFFGLLIAFVGYILDIHKMILRKPIDKSSGRILREDILKDDRLIKFYLKKGEEAHIADEIIDNGQDNFKIYRKNATGALTTEETYPWRRFYLVNLRDFINNTHDNLFVFRYDDNLQVEQLTNENFALKNEIIRMNELLGDLTKNSSSQRLISAKVEYNIEKWKPKMPYYIGSNKNTNNTQTPINPDEQGDTV